MRTWIIDAAALQSREQLHEWASAALPLPPYYGRSLDALHDVLCELGTETSIQVHNAGELPGRFGRWGQSVLRMLVQTGAQNPHLTVEITAQ